MFVIGAYFNDCVILFAWKERYTEDCCFEFFGELMYLSRYIFVFVCHDATILFGCFS